MSKGKHPEIVGYLDERDLDVMPRDLAEHLQGEKNFPFKTPLIRLADYEALAALAAHRPAVQGEPVAMVDADDDGMWADILPNVTVKVGQILYAAPQPAEQQPPADGSLTPVPDELFAAEFNAWWEQRGQFCRAGGGDYERTFAFEAWRHLYPKLMKLQEVAAEQKPAPDVTQLVEALEQVIKSAPSGGPLWHGSEQIVEARAALAAYRKGGES